jgi:hypothetical protein
MITLLVTLACLAAGCYAAGRTDAELEADR